MNILIANRGEVALRVAQAAADLGARCVAVIAQGDPLHAHTRAAPRAVSLPGSGPAAYLGEMAAPQAPALGALSVRR